MLAADQIVPQEGPIRVADSRIRPSALFAMDMTPDVVTARTDFFGEAGQ